MTHRIAYCPPEPITLDSRRYFTKAQRAKLFARSGGCCDLCGSKVRGKWIAGHLIPWAQGGETVLENGRVECLVCAVETHKRDTSSAAKAERQGGRTGQWARRTVRGGSMIRSRNDLRKK